MNNAERNTRAKATCRLADLRFLLQIANHHNLGKPVLNLIHMVEQNPTEPVITAAWKHRARVAGNDFTIPNKDE
ncbi:MAG: hypothetical protein IPN33_25720 [Saprospiraceae bacterium]|nr:hypothetical protein [Saprospiraceae bacterium]